MFYLVYRILSFQHFLILWSLEETHWLSSILPRCVYHVQAEIASHRFLSVLKSKKNQNEHIIVKK